MNCPTCNTHIDEHPASRCLDAWVAEAVMKTPVRLKVPVEDWYIIDGIKDVPAYSTSIAAAWVVVEKLPLGKVHLLIVSGETLINFDGYQGAEARAETAPLAICRAAIKAVQG